MRILHGQSLRAPPSRAAFAKVLNLKVCVAVVAQAESLWLHLPIITELASMCHKVFEGGSVQYAYTTIPTYPRFVLAPCPCSHPVIRTWHHMTVAQIPL